MRSWPRLWANPAAGHLSTKTDKPIRHFSPCFCFLVWRLNRGIQTGTRQGRRNYIRPIIRTSRSLIPFRRRTFCIKKIKRRSFWKRNTRLHIFDSRVWKKDATEPTSLSIYKNLAIANRSRVSCAYNTLRVPIGINITPWPSNLG